MLSERTLCHNGLSLIIQDCKKDRVFVSITIVIQHQEIECETLRPRDLSDIDCALCDAWGVWLVHNDGKGCKRCIVLTHLHRQKHRLRQWLGSQFDRVFVFAVDEHSLGSRFYVDNLPFIAQIATSLLTVDLEDSIIPWDQSLIRHYL
jgi:hypothetical protein